MHRHNKKIKPASRVNSSWFDTINERNHLSGLKLVNFDTDFHFWPTTQLTGRLPNKLHFFIFYFSIATGPLLHFGMPNANYCFLFGASCLNVYQFECILLVVAHSLSVSVEYI